MAGKGRGTGRALPLSYGTGGRAQRFAPRGVRKTLRGEDQDERAVSRRRNEDDEDERDADDRVRVDKWLWAARFFKTRALAAEAIEGGKVEVNGERAKRARALQVGDRLWLRMGAFEHHLVVRGLSNRRGPASEAQQLYEETEASRKAREALALQMRSVQSNFSWDGKPTKKERREIDKFRGRE